MAITKAELAKELAQLHNITQKKALEILESFLDLIRDSLNNGVQVKFSGFGNFILSDKPARPGRNPKTGKAYTISARRVASFLASEKFKKVIEDNSNEK